MSELDASKLRVRTVSVRKTYPPAEELKFGKLQTDHMLTVDWSEEEGWGVPEIKPYEPFVLDPASSVLHYAFECFEGQKAFKDVDGGVRVFRPHNNMARLRKSAARLALPSFNIDEATKLLLEFVKVEKDVIPEGRGYSLYLRPAIISTNVGLGVAQATSARLFIIASPVGAVSAAGAKSVRLKATDEAVRAWPGGTGNAKVGGNYAPCVLPQRQAEKEGFMQNLWLFNGYLTEVGMMNLFLVLRNQGTGRKELTTAPLDGLILEGITRLTVLELARERLDPNEWDVTERLVHIDELAEKAAVGDVLEVFGAGTAAIVSPVSEIGYHGTSIPIPVGPDGGAGETASLVKKWIQDIQYGVEDHPYCQRV